jgi:hypothetical protein
MRSEKFYTAGHVVKKSNESFFQKVEVGGISRMEEFKKEIIWILETQSQIVFFHGDKPLKEATTFNDYYGLYTSIEQAVREAEELAKNYQVTRYSSLEIKVMSKAFLRPAQETEETRNYNNQKANNYKLEFMSIPGDWRVKEFHENGEAYFPLIQEKEIFFAPTYSTKLNQTDNEELAKKIKESKS